MVDIHNKHWRNHMIEIEQFTGTEADVNAFLLTDTSSVIAVDLLRNSAEAESFADRVVATGKTLTAIFITHGHPDHYLGLGVFHRRFPTVPVYVATQEIKDDIIGFTEWMNSVGWLEGEPTMKVRSERNPEGFPYVEVLQVLESDQLNLPGVTDPIIVKSDYPGNECGHMTTLSIPTQNVMMASDLIYDKVHAWCGSGVDRNAINEWIHILNELKATTTPKWTLYAGHGQKGGHERVDNMINYLQTFLAVTTAATSQAEAIESMTNKFPGFSQADFLLVHSVAFHVG
jgi:glyoxylase-like metal-dependent hydrolase (beta-lactamase superfamily II)